MAAEADAAEFGTDLDPDFADAPGPTGLVGVDAGVADELAVGLGDDGGSIAAVDIAEPFRDAGGLGDIGAQEEQIVLRQGAGEGEDFVLVARCPSGAA